MKALIVLSLLLIGCRKSTVPTTGPVMSEQEQTSAIIEIQKQLANLTYLNQLQFRRDSTLVSLADTLRVKGLITNYLMVKDVASEYNDTLIKISKKPDLR